MPAVIGNMSAKGVGKLPEFFRCYSASVIADADKEGIFFIADFYFDMKGLSGVRNTMCNGILHEWLKNKLTRQKIFNSVVYGKIPGNHIRLTYADQLQVKLRYGKLLPERYENIGVVQEVTVKLRKIYNGLRSQFNISQRLTGNNGI